MKLFRVFIVLFLLNLSLDIYFNNAKEFYDFRIVTKPLITILLAIFFYFNSTAMQLRHRLMVFAALATFCAGDIALLEDTPFHSFLTGLGFFLLAILLYCLYLYRQTRYDVDRLIPFLAISLLTSLSLIYLMYDGLNNLLIPVMIYMAVVLNFLKLTYLRYKNVNIKSYRLVFVGGIFFTIAQILIGLNRFYLPLLYKDIYIMFFYGIAQLLIIVGILYINCPEDEQIEESSLL
jgi:uncharacterized membrane protein YhhN